MASVLLVQSDGEIRAVLQTAGERLGAVAIQEAGSAGEAVARLQHDAQAFDGLILGPLVERPIDLAQRAHALEPDLSILVLCEPVRHPNLARALGFTPFLGEEVRCRSIADTATLPEDLTDLVRRTRQRRETRAALTRGLEHPASLSLQSDIGQYVGQLLDHAPIGVVTIDGAGEVLGWNLRAADMLALTEREVLGRPLVQVFALHEAGKWHDLFSRVGGPERQPPRGVFERTPASGKPQFVEITAAPLAGHGGSILLLQDVTTRVTAEREREDALHRLAFVAEASTLLVGSLDYTATLRRLARLLVPFLGDWCSVHVVDDDGTIRRVAVVHANPERADAVRRLQEGFPVDRRAAFGVARVIRAGQAEFRPRVDEAGVAAVAENPDHQALLLELGFRSYMCVPLIARGRTFGAISLVAADSGREYTDEDRALAEDIARRAALALDNGRLYREAQDANRTKDEFLATLSHELRTPLHAILGWARLLRIGRLDAETADRALETIERNTRAQAQLIEDLLDVSRIITGKLRLNVRLLDLGPLIEAAVDAVRPAAQAKSIRLEAVLDGTAGPVAGDADRLQQVVWNLLSNAIKFTPEGGQVDVGLERAGSHARIRVRDTGRGISREFLPYVFERFLQADSSRIHGGLGLGLAIVRHLVELHGGTVEAESGGERQGATFTVTLPLAPARERRDGRSAGAAVERTASDQRPWDRIPRLDGLSVLVVEDDVDARELLTAMLSQSGARVTAVASAADALAVLAETTPDVLLSDIAMPEEDGYTLIRKVRALPPERGGAIPAAALTAFARAEERLKCLAAGFQVHVPKPVNPDHLVTVVARLVKRSA